MKFLTISKFALVLIIPFLIFLVVANYASFNKSYYASKLSEYGANIPEADSINEKTIDFVSGKNDELPDAYSEREKQHLADVRHIVKIPRIALYSLMLLSIALFLASAFIIKDENSLANFTGKVLAYGGILTILLAGLLFILISLNFQSSFSSFHTIFFEQGTYIFDPTNEIIVNLYPEQLFMDLGLRISKAAILASIAAIAIGFLLLSKTLRTKVQ